MRKNRQFIGAFVLAVTIAALLGTAAPAFASGSPGGPNRGTCGFLQGILYKMPADVAETLAPLFSELFGCDL
jgi:hypothetical protein